MSSRPSRGAARLAAILDALPDALLLVNANGTVVNANTIALEAFETPGTALVGRGLLDLLPQFDSKLIPGSMRRPDHMDPRGRTKPTRMVARRTDGSEFPVEVTSANLENGQQAYDGYGYSSASDELLMLVVRDLSGTVDTEAELARSQRQTEMILRAASEGVVGTDTDGRIVLVNPAAAQILGYRASDLGAKELHTLVLHSRADGSPFPYDESPLADTLRSGRKHRVRGQVLWSKSGDRVAVDLTTAPVRDGDQLVGAVMTFTDRRPYDALAEEKDGVEKRHADELEKLSEEHASDLTALRQQHVTELGELRERHEEELAAGEERYASLGEREKDRYEALAGRHEQLLTLLGESLRGPLDELRRELAALAADDAGQLWPEANQVLHHLSAGYSRITTLIDNVLGYQRLDTGSEVIARTKVMLDAVVAAGVDGAVDLIGPGRVQFAVHAPPIEAEVDARLLATALAHLVADVAGVDATGNAPVSAGGYMDNTVVVAAAQRGEVVRIEVRGPYAGGDPVHEPIVRGIVRAHGGVLQTHEVPGMSGSAYVLEVPLGGGAGAMAAPAAMALPALAAGGGAASAAPATAMASEEDVPGEYGAGGRRRARRSSVDAFLEGDVPAAEGGAEAEAAVPTGRRRRRAGAAAPEETPGELSPAMDEADGSEGSGGTGRRRGRSAEIAVVGADAGMPAALDGGVSEGAVVTAAEHAAGTAASGTGLGGTVPPQGVPAPGGQRPPHHAPDGRQPQNALPPALPALAGAPAEAPGTGPDAMTQAETEDGQPTGRRRRALAAANERAAAQEAGPRAVFALPPAQADRAPDGAVGTSATAQGTQAPQAAQAARAVGPIPVPGSVPAPAPAPVQALGAVQVPAQGPVPAQAHAPVPAQAPVQGSAEDSAIDHGRHDAVPLDQADDHTPPQPHPTNAPTGRRRRAVAQAAEVAAPAQVQHQQPQPPLSRSRWGSPSPSSPPPRSRFRQPCPSPDSRCPGSRPRGSRSPRRPPPAERPPSPSRTRPGRVSRSRPKRPRPRQPPPPRRRSPHRWRQRPAVVPASARGRRRAAAGGAAVARRGRGGPAGGPQLDAGSGDQRADPGAGRAVHPAGRAGAAGTAVAASTAGSARTAGSGDASLAAGSAVGAGHGHPRPARPRWFRAAPQAGDSARPDDAPGADGTSAPVGRAARRGTGAGAGRRGSGARHGTHAGGRARTESRTASLPRGSVAARAGWAGDRGRRTVVRHRSPGRERRRGARAAGRARWGRRGGGPAAAAAAGRRAAAGAAGQPRRLLVWPAPDVSTQQALSDRGYRPVIVHSREEVDAQIAAFPAALFVDPLTGPITRTALQSLRTAAVAAEVPVLVTAGLGQATREAAYGADPAVLLKALAPRDSEQHPPRVLLIEEHAEIALALTSTLERRGMQVARAASDADAVTLAGQLRPNLVVMDLMQVHRRQSGILDWLRANGQLNRTPLVVYTAAVDPADLPRLASGETVLFLAERSTSAEVQSRIVDLLARIGTN